jgi:hypothetical protein
MGLLARDAGHGFIRVGLIGGNFIAVLGQRKRKGNIQTDKQRFFELL